MLKVLRFGREEFFVEFVGFNSEFGKTLMRHLLLGDKGGDVLGIVLYKCVGFRKGIEKTFEKIIVVCSDFLAYTS